MVATVRDTVRWSQTLFGSNTILAELEKAEMHTFVATSQPNLQYRLGVIERDLDPGGKAYGHNGGIPGYCTMMLYFGAIDSSLAIVVNHDLRENTLTFAFEGVTSALFGWSPTIYPVPGIRSEKF